MTDRRMAIADAAIATLARHGMRGLTHRAVDEAAGLPPGSTSYYVRTRAALLSAAVERLAVLDAADLAVVADGVDPVRTVLGLVGRSLTSGRERQLARYELSLEATRRPDLRAALRAGTEALADALTPWLADLGASDPRARARDLLAMLDGVVLAELTGTDGPARDAASLEAAVRHAITAALTA